MILLNIFVFLISLSLVIIIHEFGHFLFARRAGILCHEFSLGMGPVLWKTKRGETTFSIRAIPIGGFVMMAGEEVESEIVKVGDKVRLRFDDQNKIDRIVLNATDETYENYEEVIVTSVDLKGMDMAPLYLNEYEVKRDAFFVLKGRELQLAPHERNFGGKSRGQRFWAIFGGPMMNFILAIVVFFIVNLIVGFPKMDSSIIGHVGTDYPADNVLEVGDEVTSVNGVPVTTWEELSEQLNLDNAIREYEIVVVRDGETLTLTLTPILFFYNVGIHSQLGAVNDLTIGSVGEGTFADKIGFQENDVLTSINGNTVLSWGDVITQLSAMGEEPYDPTNVYTFAVERGGNNIVLTNEVSGKTEFEQPFNAAFLETQGLSVVITRIGINPEYGFSLGKSILGSGQDLGASASVIFTTLGLLFDNEGAGAIVGVDDLAGPLGIYQITSQALSQGFVSLLSWIGLLSVNLGIVNLLPIPALDGGRLVFLGYETLTRRKPNQKVENTLHYVMYLALLGLFVFITFNDLLRLLNLK